MVHSHGSQDSWSSLSSVESLGDLSIPTPPPSKGSSGFRRLSARTAADMAKPPNAAAAMAQRSHRLPSEMDIKCERYRYAPPDREIWRPAIEQLSQKISEQQHELWDLQTKLREESRHSDDLVAMLKTQRKEHKEVVTALTSELSARRDAEAEAVAQATRQREGELESTWKRCSELERRCHAAEEDVSLKNQALAALEVRVGEMQTQIAGLKLVATQSVERKSEGDSEAVNAELMRENSGLKNENTRLRNDLRALESASRVSKADVEALQALKRDHEMLKSNVDTIQATNVSLQTALDAESQQSSLRVKQAADAAWNQASQLAAEKLSESSKQANVEISRLNEKTEAQAAIIASQKEFITMANTQLEYMRGLLGESIGKLLEQRAPSSRTPHLQPSPLLHAATFRPSPPPEASEMPQISDLASSALRPRAHSRRSNSDLGTSKPATASPRRQASHQAGALRSPTHTPQAQMAALAVKESSTDNLATADLLTANLSAIEPDSARMNRRGRGSRHPSSAYPLQQSTMNNSTTTASSTSTPNSSEHLDETRSLSDESHSDVSFLDALYDRLAQGKLSREELEDFEHIYDARTEIMAERPKLEFDAKKMLSDLRPHVSRKHAPVVSRMASDMP